MDYRKLLEAATGREKADLVLKNGLVLDVYNAEFFGADVAIHQGHIVGIGEYEGHTERDCSGQYIVPALIDGHMHLESAMVTPAQYARGVLPHGVATVIADPHEVANVAGAEAIRWLMAAAKDLPVDFRIMIPSCVPSAKIDHSGSVLGVDDMIALRDHPQAHGLGEVMDFPSLLHGSEEIAEKLAAFDGLPMDGHAPGITGKDLNAYVAAGIQTEHECSTREEMEERIRLGMYIQIREGTAARNAEALLPAVDDRNWRRCFFCTDDIEPSDILADGTIDELIRRAMAAGIDPAKAYTMGSHNAATAYGLPDRGAISPGKRADLLIVDDLASVAIREVLIQGRSLVKDGVVSDFTAPEIHRPHWPVKVRSLQKNDLELTGTTYNALVMEPGSLLTRLETGSITQENFPYAQGLNKLVNVERHKGLDLHGVCAMRGLGITNGAIATTIVHDAHNLLCAGSNDEDILLAIERAAALGGGIIMVSQGQIVHELPLPIYGLITDATIEDTADALRVMISKAHDILGIPEHINPFLALSFMGLPVIPEVKLTVEGLFSVTEQRLISPTQ